VAWGLQYLRSAGDIVCVCIATGDDGLSAVFVPTGVYGICKAVAVGRLHSIIRSQAVQLFVSYWTMKITELLRNVGRGVTGQGSRVLNLK